MIACAVFYIINKSSKSLSLPREVPHDPTLTYIPVHLPNIPSRSLCHSQAEHLVLPYTSGHFLLLREPLSTEFPSSGTLHLFPTFFVTLANCLCLIPPLKWAFSKVQSLFLYPFSILPPSGKLFLQLILL